MEHLKSYFSLGRAPPVDAAVNTQQERSSLTSEEVAYLAELDASVRARSFDLDNLPVNEVIPTGRTIRLMAAWNSEDSPHWPALREFLQNTQDHLVLWKEGRLNPALKLDRKDTNNTINFKCGNELICAISTPSNNKLVIEQFYTFPLPLRALDTGVPDVSKVSSSTAGGFGDGFKSAVVALLAEDNKASI